MVVFLLLLVTYVLVEYSRPKPFDWTITLSKEDKNPYGGYVLYNQLKDLFPQASIHTYHTPVYDQVNNSQDTNTAYLLIDPVLALSSEDINELLNYVVSGNFVFIASGKFSQALADTLRLRKHAGLYFLEGDSVPLNFSNPRLRVKENYGNSHMIIDGYFDRFDTAETVVLGTTRDSQVNFIKMPYGEGALFIHCSPVCFSNYFILKNNNADYAAKALSYIPPGVSRIYWDEYYKTGRGNSENLWRVIFANPFLLWAFRIALVAMVLFVLFEMKRKQRIIPVISALSNSTLDFVNTVGNVYFNQHDNKNIAQKKINYFLEYLRSVFYLNTSNIDSEFVEVLAKKSGLEKQQIEELVVTIQQISGQVSVSDDLLLEFNRKMDFFYENLK